MSTMPTSASSQRSRVLAQLKKGPLSVSDLTETMGITRPCACIDGLMKAGHSIFICRQAAKGKAQGRVVLLHFPKPTGEGA